MAIRKSAASTRRARFQFTLKQLLVAVAVFAVLLGVWVRWLRKVVYVREARPEDTVAERYLGFENAETYFGIAPRALEIRNIVVATGRFRNSTRLLASLHIVRSGVIDQANSMTVGKSSARIGSPLLGERYHIKLALGHADTPEGRMTLLGSSGFTTGAGTSGSMLTHKIAAAHAKTLPGWVTPGKQYIVYVEGDGEPYVSRKMSLEEFGKKNSGNYLVITVELR